MKYLIAFLIGLQVFCNVAFAQCDSCCDESFPYSFCKSGKLFTTCSKNPSTDHPTGATPVKAFIPGCVHIFTMPSDGIYQPVGDSINLPTVPDDLSQFDDNLDELLGAQDQSKADNSIMQTGRPPEFDSTFFPDSLELIGALKQYGIDTLIYNQEKNNYVKLWDQTQAETDANFALQQWLNICPDVKSLSLQNATQSPDHKDHKNCCINVISDTNADDFHRNPLVTAHTDSIESCSETSCPTRLIRVNRTPIFLYWGNDPQTKSESKYWLHHVARFGLFTGMTPPNPRPFVGTDTLNPQYGAVSFRELMEHEMGHWFGLWHPDRQVNKDSCSNNWTITSCQNNMVMVAGQIPNDTPHVLTKDDSCYFKKLYCSNCIYGAVKTANEQFVFNPKIYPNPSSGSTFLEYETDKEETVEVSLYNLLGKEIINILSERQDQGEHILQLPTQYLATGEYVCRITAGKKSISVKIVITR
jgi:hypothetical protein